LGPPLFAVADKGNCILTCPFLVVKPVGTANQFFPHAPPRSTLSL
jgi:hypothetical protein